MRPPAPPARLPPPLKLRRTRKPRHYAYAAETIAVVSLGVALIATWRGGWQAELFGTTVSVRAVWRPFVVAALAGAIRLWLARRDVPRVASWSAITGRVLSGSILIAGILGWLTFLTPYVGGADSYGYVSAADRIGRGTLIQHEPLAPLLPDPDLSHGIVSLGYVPAARVPGASVPAYPLGLSALMAFATALFGSPAAFYVSIVMGLVLVASAYWIAVYWFGDRLVALTTAAMLAVHPLVFAYAIQPMSDVPAAACYLLAVACLSSLGTRFSSLLGGVAAGAAFFIRPALLPALVALAALPLTVGSGRARKTAEYLAGIALAVGTQAWLHWYLYGSVSASGYGGATDLFALAYAPANARSYGYWSVLLHGPVWIAGLAIGLWHLRNRSTWIVLASVGIGALAPYAIYRTYDHWETLRFLMPLVIVATMIAVHGLFTGARRLTGQLIGSWLALALSVSLLVVWVEWLDRFQVFGLARAQERFSAAGDFVERITPTDAVIVTSLHSGSIRYYAHRDTLDWSDIPVGRFEATVRLLQNHHRPVFLMLDGSEEITEFESRHGTVNNDRGWLPAGQYRDVRLYEIRLSFAKPGG